MTIAAIAIAVAWTPALRRADRAASPAAEAQPIPVAPLPPAPAAPASPRHPALYGQMQTPRKAPAEANAVPALHFPDPLPELPKIDPPPRHADYHGILTILRGTDAPVGRRHVFLPDPVPQLSRLRDPQKG